MEGETGHVPEIRSDEKTGRRCDGCLKIKILHLYMFSDEMNFDRLLVCVRFLFQIT